MWKTRAPELLEEGRATFLAHDFFTPQPPIPAEILRKRSLGKYSDRSEPSSAATSPTRVSFGLDQPHIVEHSGVGSEEAVDGEKKPAVFLLRVVTHDWPNSFVTRYVFLSD